MSNSEYLNPLQVLLENQATMNQIVTQLLADKQHPQVARQPRLPDIRTFDGSRVKYTEFLVQLQNFFHGQSALYTTDKQRIAYIVSRLTGPALKWIQPTILSSLKTPQPVLESMDVFMTAFDRAFKDTYAAKRATDELLDLTQGSRSVLDYYTEFVNLLYCSSIDKVSAVSLFERGLSSEIRNRMADKEYSSDFDTFAEQVLALDSRLASNKKHSHRPIVPLPPSGPLGYAPMQVDGINLRSLPKLEARELCIKEGRCFYCKEVGHRLSECKLRSQRSKNTPQNPSSYPSSPSIESEPTSPVPRCDSSAGRGAGLGTSREVILNSLSH